MVEHEDGSECIRTLLYSASKAFSEEIKIDFVMLRHWLERFKISLPDFMRRKNGTKYNLIFYKRFHASGHASREDIASVIDQIDPDHVVPIHTETWYWFAESFENVILPKEDTDE